MSGFQSAVRAALRSTSAALLCAAVGLALPPGASAQVAAGAVASSAASAASAVNAANASDAASAASAASAAAAGTAPEVASGTPAVVRQPRGFGHVIGDVLTQALLLEHEGQTLTPSVLPPADRVGLWLERRAARTEDDAEGRRWLLLDYQVINAPRALVSVSLPALQVATTAGRTLAVPAWPLSIGPLTPETVLGQGDLQPLRPDRPVVPVDTAALQRQLVAPLVALGGVLLAWLGWWLWRNAREATHLPFARAWLELRRLARTHRGEPLAARPEAWLSVHRALNATAGRVVPHAALPRLLAEAPHLRPMGERLDSFFRHSAARFFAGVPASAPYELLELCRDLRQAEQRHAR